MKARTSDRSSQTSTGGDLPLVWVLQGHRAGDNLQVQALADGLGWPSESKDLTWQKNWLGRLPQWTQLYGRSASLKHLTPETKQAFQPKWPDVVISIGWRSVPVARWIKKQCEAKLVHLGRPRAPLSYFDLVLTTPQYRLPETPNVVQLTGPLMTLSPMTLAAASTAWAPRLAHLPNPWIAVLVGGDTPSLKFPPSAAAALAKAANAHAMACGGSLLVATSPRTPHNIADILRDQLTVPMSFHQWRKEADNPYAAFLALADQFIVTNDSISMTHEAALTGRPVHIFPLSPEENHINQALLTQDRKLQAQSTVFTKAYQSLIRHGVLYPPKSPDDYFETLLQCGRAAILGSTDKICETTPPPPDNDRAVAAVQALIVPAQQGSKNSG